MSASTNDLITNTRNAARPNSARATGTRATGGTSLACDNLAGWPTASKVHFVTYQIDSDSNPVTGTQLDCTGIVSGNTIGTIVVKDGTDTGNSVNDVVEMLPTAAWGQDLADALTAQHTRTGAHTAVTTDTLTVTTGTTLPAGDIATADLADSAVTPAKLLTGAGSSWAWQSWTPTYTNVTIGNGTVIAKYIQTGKTVEFKYKLTWGSSTSFNASPPTITLPVTSTGDYDVSTGQIGFAQVLDSSAATAYIAFPIWQSTTTMKLLGLDISNARYEFSSAAPMAWATGDILYISGTYEAA